MSSELYITEGSVFKPRSHTHEVRKDCRSFELKEGLVSTVQTLDSIVVVGNPCLSLLARGRNDKGLYLATLMDGEMDTHT
jgi:hypothetical protein